jgi:uncharacterized membrane protein
MVLILLLLLASVGARQPKKDPGTGRIRILYIGDAWGPSPYFHMEAEPSFLGTPIPATYAHAGTYGDRELRQFMRIYMPRNFKEFSTSYDLLILSDTNRALYRLDQLEWFKRGVSENGIGIMMVGGIEAFGGDNHPTWGGSPVEDALPVTCLDGQTFRKDFGTVVNHEDDPFIKSLPWETMPFYHGMNVVAPKDGSKTLLQSDLTPYHPILSYWEFGEGSGLAHMPDWTPAWGSSIMYYWNFYSDFIANMNYLNAGVEIPQNPEMMHLLRNLLRSYSLNRALSVSLMEFVEKFGAKISIGEEHLNQIGETYKDAQRLFIEQEYDECLSTLYEIEEEFELLSQELVELKSRALLWIYMVEWLTVSGTAIICGVVLWSLMVRRRLYREVNITRA